MRLTLITLSSAFLFSLAYASPLQSLTRRAAASVAGYSYQGCYTEATDMRALTGSAYFDDLLTLEKCAIACSAYSWFGVEYGRECYCGDIVNLGSLSTLETDCNFACPGNSAETCGAGNRLNMYKKSTGTTTSSTSTTSTVTTPTPDNYLTEGCYTEATNGRALTDKAYYDDAMTVEMCAAACDGFKYFGVEYYRECYCGNTLQAGSGPAPATDCRFTCSGDSTELCGGDWRLNLYTFGTTTTTSMTSTTSTTLATPSPVNYAFEGCYTEATNSRALTGAVYYNDAMTIEKCAAVCAGWTWFGVEFARECYCGNTIQAGSVPALTTDCNFTCPGNSAQFCGAGNRLDMYQFGATASTSSSLFATSSSSTLLSTSTTTSTSFTFPSSSTTSTTPSTTFDTTSTTTSTTSTPDPETTSLSSTTSTPSTTSTASSTTSATTSTTSTMPTPTSIINNSGFEATDSTAVGWANSGCVGGSCPVVNFMVPSNTDIAAHGGSQMASITYKANSYAASFEQSFPTNPGTTYTYSIWTWSPTNGNGCSWTFYQLATGVTYQAQAGPSLANAANRGVWVKSTGTFTSQTATSMKFHPQLACNSGLNPRTFYIDDLFIAPA